MDNNVPETSEAVAETNAEEVKKEKKRNPIARGLNAYFDIYGRGSNIKKEIFAGLLVFFEVIAFMMVNAELLASSTDMSSYHAVYFASVLVTAITSVLVGMLCNVPFVQSASLGMTVLIVTLVGQNAGLTYANVMAIALVANVVYFIVMVIPPARAFLFNAVPDSVRKALPAALGAFIIVYVLVQLNVLRINTMNFADDLASMASAGTPITTFTLNYVSFNLDIGADADWYTFMPVITSVIAFVALLVLKHFNVKHATIIAFGGSLVLYVVMWLIRRNFTDYYFFAFVTPAYGGMYFYDGVNKILRVLRGNFFGAAFTQGFDFGGYADALAQTQADALGVAVEEVSVNAGGRIFMIFVTAVLSFLILGVSETGATVAGHAFASGTADERGRALHTQNAFLRKAAPFANVYAVNALSSVFGCIMGAGPVVARPESLTGTSEGGRTGLTAVVAGLLFIATLFTIALSGLFINGMVVYGILFYVGLTLLTAFKNCDFTSFGKALPFLATVVTAAVSLDFAAAIAIGVVSDTLMRALSRDIRSITVGNWVLTGVMLLSLIFGFVY